MGKIRIKKIGVPEIEEQDKYKAKKRREKKKQKKKTAKTPGLKGGERVVAVGPSPEELEKQEDQKTPSDDQKSPTHRILPRRSKKRSLRYKNLIKLIDKNKLYELDEAIKLLKKTANVNFSETVEAHINLKSKLKQKKSKKGVIKFEKKFPLAHAVLGKVNEDNKKLKKSLELAIKSVGSYNIKKLTLSTTMGPGIKISL